jgi:aerobic carbon-monoxide dehydrogenase medium subunit
MPELQNYLRPGSLAEAIGLLEEHGEAARPLAGGTSLVFSRSSRLGILVDLGRAGLDRIDGPGNGSPGLRIGAMATLAALGARLRGAGPRLGALHDAATGAGSRILQRHITVGGNCVMVYAWSDLPPALISLGAEFLLEGPAGRRTLAARELFADHPVHLLGKSELLVEVRVPAAAPPGVASAGSAHLKFVRNATDQSLVSVSARVDLGSDGKVAGAAIAVGAMRALPQILEGCLEKIVGRAPEPPALEETARAAALEARGASDYRATAEYKQEILVPLVEDALGRCVSRAGGAA